jgi:hypothetical protein
MSSAPQVALAQPGYFDADIYSQSDKFAGYLTSIAPNDGDEVSCIRFGLEKKLPLMYNVQANAIH